MAILNTNPIIREDDDHQLDSSFIRITTYTINDYKESHTDIDIQFRFYASKEKWIAAWRQNAIQVQEEKEYHLKIPYSREEHGIDIMGFLYTKLIEHLLAIPSWSIDNIEFDLASPATDAEF